MWAEGSVSLLGINEYFISAEWVLEERLLSAEPFEGSHTGDAIEAKSVAAIKAAGIGADLKEEDDIYTEIFHCVSDNGANIVKGWSGFDGGFCAAHTAELAVNTFLDDDAVKPTVKKIKGICSTCKCRDVYLLDCMLCKIKEKSLISVARFSWVKSVLC